MSRSRKSTSRYSTSQTNKRKSDPQSHDSAYVNMKKENDDLVKQLAMKDVALKKSKAEYEKLKRRVQQMELSQTVVNVSLQQANQRLADKLHTSIQNEQVLELVEKAKKAFVDQDYAKAFKSYGEAIKFEKSKPVLANLWNEKGVCCYKLEKSDEAIKCFKEAIQIDPNDAVSYYNSALVHKHLGKHWNALVDARKAFKSNPNCDVVKKLIAEVEPHTLCYDAIEACDEKNYDAALKLFSEAICAEMAGFNRKEYVANLMNRKGCCYFNLKENSHAIDWFSMAISFQSNVASFYRNRAGCYLRVDRLVDARDDLQKALELKPDWEAVKQLLASIEEDSQL